MTTDDVSEVLKKFKDAITPEMEKPKMRGKGADLFARRRQRMEKFVITDESRNQKLDYMTSANGFVAVNEVDPNKNAESSPPTPSTPGFSQPHSFYQPSLSTGNTLSGYCTDMEDDRPSFHRNMKINYFSDCEDMGDITYERKGRKGRPVSRRAWETDVEDAYKSETGTSMSNIYKLPSPSYTRGMPKTESPGWTSAQQTPAHPLSSTAQHKMLPPRSFATQSVPKRTWSRVTFCPKKPSTQRSKLQPTIQYPCERKTEPSGIQQNSIHQANATKPANFHSIIANKRINTNKPMNRPKTLSVNQILPKIDERPTHYNTVSSNHHQLIATAGNKTDPATTMNSTPTTSHKSSATITITTRKRTPRQEQEQAALKTSEKIMPDTPLDEKRPESSHDNDDNRRTCSSASVASYVSSNSSMLTSTTPTRCLTPIGRSRTPTGVPRVLKIAGPQPISPYPTESSPTPFNTPTPLEQTVMKPTSGEQSDATEDNKSCADKKVSACLKVLDPTRSLSLPKSTPYHASPSPTLNAVLKQETTGNSWNQAGVAKEMDRVSHWMDTTTMHPQQISNRQLPIANRTPQALGSMAEGMKGKGARMFEKQQKRMQNYTKETSKDSYPDLAYPNDPNSPSAQQPFSQTMAYPPPGDVKMGMRDVMGEFQKCSQPGNVKRPSETKNRTRDPLHYQQQLTYRPPRPSSVDFMESNQNLGYINNGNDLPANFQMYPSANDFVQTPPSIPSPNDPRWTFGDDVKSTRSTSSMSSQKSLGPKTAPKPAKVVIQRQLSRESMKQLLSSSELENGDNLLPPPSQEKTKDDLQ